MMDLYVLRFLAGYKPVVYPPPPPLFFSVSKVVGERLSTLHTQR